jgi:hypothetical protein
VVRSWLAGGKASRSHARKPPLPRASWVMTRLKGVFSESQGSQAVVPCGADDISTAQVGRTVKFRHEKCIQNQVTQVPK